MTRTPLARLRQGRRLLRSEGAQGVVNRARRSLAERLAPAGAAPMGIALDDVRAVGRSAHQPLPPPLPRRAGEPLRIGFVTVPPGPGSGGHTTMFRLAASLEAAGHECTVYLRDRHGWDFEQHRRTIHEWWPWLTCRIEDFAEGVDDAHALVATGWSSAWWLRGSQARGVRFYLVQDFEPAFHPAGSEYLLAEATYGFGYHGVTAGAWLADKLTRDYGMPADAFEFGCDLDVYSLDATQRAGDRDGIAYYCRPDTPRRAHELAVLGLELFAERHPEVPIHFYGSRVSGLPFAAVQHGLLDPVGLDRLYNRCVAGLVLSATNVSLVPLEMLASGCIPVVNDAEHNRAVLLNDQVAYAAATPQALADRLSGLVASPASIRSERCLTAARSVAGASWASAGERVEQVIAREVASRQLPWASPVPTADVRPRGKVS